MEEEIDREKGIQPLDGILEELGLANKDLVSFSSEQLTNKQVQKGRKGRLITGKIQRKILNALNSANKERSYKREDVFNYRS